MDNLARTVPAELPAPPSLEERDAAIAPTLPVLMNVKEMALPAAPMTEGGLKFVDVTANPVGMNSAGAKKKEPQRGEAAVLRGIKDLQELQKQTIAVLESVKGTLDEIQQVLRSPEATRGMEKQQNAAMLLTKGFAREAAEQAAGAVALLPANPEAHLLWSLSLAADGQYELSLGAARKGLALVDRRRHPLAIECGLLHALAALGCAAEALERWGAIIDSLPLPVLFEQMGRIASCFPTEGNGGGSAMLDDLLNRRLARDIEKAAEEQPEARRERIRQEEGKIDIRPDEIPAPTMFAGLDAAQEFQLTCTHRAILAQVARRLQLVKEAGDVVKFLGECVVPLANRGLDRSARSLARASVKRLLKTHADAMTLHRAMGKMELAGTTEPMHLVAALLNHWRKTSNAIKHARWGLGATVGLAAGGAMLLVYALFARGGGAAAARGSAGFVGLHLDAVGLGLIMLLLSGFAGLYAVSQGRLKLSLPGGRSPLTGEEKSYLSSALVKQSIRGALGAK